MTRWDPTPSYMLSQVVSICLFFWPVVLFLVMENIPFLTFFNTDMDVAI